MTNTNGNTNAESHAQQLAALKGAQTKLSELERGLAEVHSQHAKLAPTRPTLAAAAFVDKKPGAAEDLKKLNGEIRNLEDAVSGYEHQIDLTQAEIRGIEAAIAELERQDKQAQLVKAQAELAQAQAVAGAEIDALGRKLADVDHCYKRVKELRGTNGDNHGERLVWRPISVLLFERISYYPIDLRGGTTREANMAAEQLAAAVTA